MKSFYKTPRLTLQELTENDAGFILDLVNTAGWLKFIGDRKVRDKIAAENYIQRIISNPAIHYRVVALTDTQTAIGVVTFIKRDYLDHADIGFAFLPAYSNQGYAFEACKVVLNDLLQQKGHSAVLAVTLKENTGSLKLLNKLGFSFSKEISHEGELLQLLSIQKD